MSINFKIWAMKFYTFEMVEYQNTKESVSRRRKETLPPTHISYGKNNSIYIRSSPKDSTIHWVMHIVLNNIITGNGPVRFKALFLQVPLEKA